MLGLAHTTKMLKVLWHFLAIFSLPLCHRIDETMRVVFSIDVFFPDTEKTTPPPPPPTNETPDRPQLLLTREKRESQGLEEEAKRVGGEGREGGCQLVVNFL